MTMPPLHPPGVDPADIRYWDDTTNPHEAAWNDIDRWEWGIAECLKPIRRYVGPNPAVWLDVGAGVGRLAIPLVERYDNKHVVAFEPSPTMRAQIPIHPRVTVVHDWPDGPFDMVYCVAVMQHLPYTQQADIVARAANRLAPRGRLVFQTVFGTNNGPGSHHTDWDTPAAWCSGAGLTVVDQTMGHAHDTWLWTHAQKAA